MPRGNAVSFVAALALIGALAACREVTIEGAPGSSGAGASTPSSTSGDGAPAGGAASVSSSAGQGAQGGSGVGGAQAVVACPVADALETGTNTVVRVESAEPIDMATVGPSSLQVLVGNAALLGSVEADAHSLTFLPNDPLPAGQLIHVVLSPAVLDDQGHALADVVSSWSFTTGSGPTVGAGFKFADPVMPPSGEHAPGFALTMDGEHPILAWGAAAGLVTAEGDGTSFPAPLVVVDGTFPDQVVLASAAGRAHIGWTYFDGPGTIFYNGADLPLASPFAAPVAMSPASYASRIAADGMGHVAMVWEVDPPYWTESGFRYSTSSDGGATWTPSIMLDPYSGCPDVAYVDGYLVVVWTSQLGNVQQIFAAASSDNGVTFGTPVTLATSATQFWCPLMTNNGAGEAVIAFEDGFYDQRSVNVTRFIPATNTAGPVTQLAAPDGAEACVRVAASPTTGKLIVARTRGHAFQNDFVSDIFASDDGGSTFGAPTPIDVFRPDEGCPDLGYTASGDVHLAWLRDPYELEWSRGRPKRPCE